MWWLKWGLPETFAEDGELDAEAAGSHPQSAERVEKLEESVCSIVRQKNEHEDQGEGVQDGGKTGTGVRGRDMGIEDGI